MNHHYEEEDLFQSVEDSYLSMVSALALGLHLKRFGESYVYPNLGNIKLSSGQYITKEVQLHALRKNPLTKFSISCALRGVFSAMYEVIKNNNTFKDKVKTILGDDNESFLSLELIRK